MIVSETARSKFVLSRFSLYALAVYFRKAVLSVFLIKIPQKFSVNFWGTCSVGFPFYSMNKIFQRANSIAVLINPE